MGKEGTEGTHFRAGWLQSCLYSCLEPQPAQPCLQLLTPDPASRKPCTIQSPGLCPWTASTLSPFPHFPGQMNPVTSSNASPIFVTLFG